ncbi:MAG: EAL domain-containing protein [Sedimenticolaceae bacterium]
MAPLETLRSSVARRILLSFVAAAALPLLMLATSAYQLVTDRLQERALDDAHRLAKELGMDIFERLKYVSDGLAMLAARGHVGDNLASATFGLDLDERVLGLFRVSPDGAVAAVPPLSEDTLAAFRQAVPRSDPESPLLLAVGEAARRRVFLLVRVGPDPSRDGLLGAELNLTHLWDTTGVAARPERVCVIGPDGAPVYCNHRNYRAWLGNSAELIATRARPRPLLHDDGQRVLTAAWSLFLKPHYQFERWTVVAGVPQSMAFASIAAFDRIFAGVAVIALLLALMLGRRMIRSNLEPLETLGEATRQLATGDFRHRADLRSGDEFQRLGEAFDRMATQIGEQFHELETLARLDRALQGTKTVEAALHAADQAFSDLLGGGRCALLCQANLGDAETLWYLAFDADAVLCSAPPSNLSEEASGSVIQALSVRDDHPLRRRLGAMTGEHLQVFPVMDNSYAAAAILLRRPDTGAEPDVQRVADVLAIALDNLILEHRLLYQAHHDWLTGLPNRSRLQDLFNAWTASEAQSVGAVGMLLLGIDRFKQVNDSIGHQQGDRLLAAVAARLREALPKEYVIGRFSGDQFLVMGAASDLGPLLPQLSALATTLGHELDRPFSLGLRQLSLTGTLGGAVFPRDGSTFEAMLQSLDAASFAAKSSRRGGLLFYSAGMRDALAGRMEVEQALKGAVTNHELVLHYQPVIDALTERVRSAEALMRWQRPGVGLVMPGGFIEVAEQSGLVVQMGAWAIAEVCRQMRAWRDAGLGIETVNVNVSGVQLTDQNLERQVRQALEETGLPGECLTLEITETSLIGRLEESVETLARLRATGVRIMIDDFGTGYASLKYLKMLPVDGLKIDRMFVKDLPDNPSDAAIVGAVVSLARASGYKLVAEGIDTAAQADALREAGVPLLQGFLFARGLPAAELDRRLQAEDGAPKRGEAGFAA